MGRYPLAISPTSSGRSKLNTPRLKRRRKVLNEIFSREAMERAWVKYVRSGLRGQEITDLHDYNDFHWGRYEFFDSLRVEIIDGVYLPRFSTPVRIEKSNGVTRTLVVPSVQDAIVLQCIVEFILERVLNKQPSKNSFFSRSHGFAGGEFSFDSQYIWFRRWKKFSNIRMKLSSVHPYICTTDIANYYDNIDYTNLRSIVSSVASIGEVAMDIMFRVFSEISWRPDYLPVSARSLPQVHFDAPRLLAHVYLYEVDEYLKEISGDSFVRWVDDITVAVGSREDGKRLLRDLDQILMTRGLRLNSGKTRILSAKEAQKFFFQKENGYLDAEFEKIKKFSGQPGRLSILKKRVRKNFLSMMNSDRGGHWDKIIKRYFTLFSAIRDEAIISYCRDIIDNIPSLRPSVWRYLSSIGPSRKSFDEIKRYVMGENSLDDASVFQATSVLVEWQVDPNSKLHNLIKDLAASMMDAKFDEKSQFFFVCGLRLLAKYGYAKEMANQLDLSSERWSGSEVLSRQVAAVIPKLRTSLASKKIQKIIEVNKFPSANSVLISLKNMRSNGSIIPNNIRMYILNGMNKTTYGIDRFLIAIHILLAKEYSVAQRVKVKGEILKYVTDPIYRRVILSIKPV